MKAYKVLRRTPSGNLASCNAPAAWSVIYSIESKTRPPKGSKLFVFKHLSDAKMFADTYGPNQREIWTCEVDVMQATAERACCNLSDIDVFWTKSRRMARSLDAVTKAPLGTYFCNWVHLTKKVV
jgi:hypothetical protein